MGPGDDAGELLAELRRLAERFPLPQPSWHRYVPEMHAVVRDLFAAIDAVAALPAAQAELARLVEGESGSTDARAGGPQLAAARERLRGLPVPQGEHPYLDEIVVTLEAAEAVLGALGAAVGGEAAFGRRGQSG